MTNILTVLVAFILIATVIMIGTDNLAEVLAVIFPKIEWPKKKLIIALVLTSFGIFGFNQGVLGTLGVATEVSRWWFHWFDLITSIFLLTKGAQGIHRLQEAIESYNRAKE